MKKVLIIIGSILMYLQGYSQQDPQYSMYMFNQLAVNPAYAGSRDCLSATAHYRTQWVGIDGAPKTLSFGIHSPLKNEKVSLGLQVINDKLGISNFTNIALSYSYRIKVNKKGKLAFGLQALATNLTHNFTEAITNQGGDPNFAANKSLLLPNFGAGLYYNTAKAYIGLTIPHLINNNLDKRSNNVISATQARQYRHLFLMAGRVFKLNDIVKVKPSFVLKYAPNSPWQTDLNCSFLFYESLWLGASWRSNFSVARTQLTESMNAMAIYEINKNMRAGIAYDLTATKLKGFNNGSYEVLLGYDLEQKKDKILSPRYF